MTHALAQLFLTIASVMGGVLFLDTFDGPARRMARRVAGFSKGLSGK
jgi:hypothetical protein